MKTLKKALYSLEERLDEHDENRKEVQNELLEVCSKIAKDADSLEEKMSGKISEDFEEKEKEILGLIEKLNRGEGKINTLVEQAQEVLSKEWKFEIQHSKSPITSFVDSYRLEVSSVKAEKKFNIHKTESIVNLLQEHFNKIQESRDAAQDRVAEICKGRRKEREELEKRINEKLEKLFEEEDARIQSVVKMVEERIDSEDPEKVKKLTRKAQLTLLNNQKYSLKSDSLDSYDLKVKKEASLKFIDFEERKPTNVVPLFTEKGKLSLSFTFFDEDETKVLKEIDSPFEVEVKMWE